jgi:dihydrofolate reductase
MTIGLIWAQDRDGVIGRDGGLPWHIPEDLAHFRAITGGGSVIMGRRTWDSLPPRFRPLPGRDNIIVTHQPSWSTDGATVVHSVEDALTEAADNAWIIGGGQLFTATIGVADALEVTMIDESVGGDTYAPVIPQGWHLASVDPAHGWHTSSTGSRYRFLRYSR